MKQENVASLPYGLSSPVRDLAAQLVGSKQKCIDEEITFATFEQAEQIGSEAITGSGAGLDLFRGERIVMAVLKRLTPRGYEHRQVVAISDSKTVVSGWSDIQGGLNGIRFVLNHCDIQQIETKRGFLSSHVALIGPSSRFELSFGKLTEVFDWFYRTLTHYYSPEQRVEPLTPWIETSLEDPSGALYARGSLWFAEPRIERILELIAAGSAVGNLGHEVTGNLTFRVVLAHRTTCGGPAVQEQAWVSALFSNDLAALLVQVLGPPLQDQMIQGTRYIDFGFDERRNSLSAAASALGIASFVALGIGFSPSKLIARAILAKHPITQLRFVLNDRSGYSLYSIQTNGVLLEQRDSMLAYRLHMVLSHGAISFLEARCNNLMS